MCEFTLKRKKMFQVIFLASFETRAASDKNQVNMKKIINLTVSILVETPNQLDICNF